MNDQPRKRRLVFLVLPSFLVALTAIIFVAGLSNTPYDTQDSTGRRMGFNDRLSREHYVIIVRNFEPLRLLSLNAIFDWALLAVHLGGILVLLSQRVALRTSFYYFAIQPLFPIWVIGVLLRPQIFTTILRGDMDREGIIDIPFVWVTSHPVWVLTSIVIASFLRRDLRKAGVDWVHRAAITNHPAARPAVRPQSSCERCGQTLAKPHRWSLSNDPSPRRI